MKNNHRFRKPQDLSPREHMLKRAFGIAVAREKYDETEFHAFCNWAKGKPETIILFQLGVR